MKAGFIKEYFAESKEQINLTRIGSKLLLMELNKLAVYQKYKTNQT